MLLPVHLQRTALEAGSRAHDLETATELREALSGCTEPAVLHYDAVLTDLVTEANQHDMRMGMAELSAAMRADSPAERAAAAAAVVARALPWVNSFWSEELRGEGRAPSSFLWNSAHDLLHELGQSDLIWRIEADTQAAHLLASASSSALLEPVRRRIHVHPSPESDVLGVADFLDELVADLPEDSYAPADHEATHDVRRQVAAVHRHAQQALTSRPARARLAFAVAARRGDHPAHPLVAAAQALRELTTTDEPEHFVAHCGRLAQRVETAIARGQGGNFLERLATLADVAACATERRPTWFLLETLARVLPLSAARPGDPEVTEAVGLMLEIFRQRHKCAGTAARVTWQAGRELHPEAVLHSAHRAWQREIGRMEAQRLADTGSRSVAIMAARGRGLPSFGGPRRSPEQAAVYGRVR